MYGAVNAHRHQCQVLILQSVANRNRAPSWHATIHIIGSRISRKEQSLRCESAHILHKLYAQCLIKPSPASSYSFTFSSVQSFSLFDPHNRGRHTGPNRLNYWGSLTFRRPPHSPVIHTRMGKVDCRLLESCDLFESVLV